MRNSPGHQETVEKMTTEFSSIITADASDWKLDLMFYFFDEVDKDLRCL